MMMIMYNTLQGLCAGLVMLIAGDALKKLHAGPGQMKLPSHAAALAVAGVPLTVLGFLMTVTWPLTANPPINIAFGEPTFILGVLALVGAAFFLRGLDLHTVALRPMAWVITAVGGMLALTASAIFSYNLVGDAPSSEPITGQFQGWENATWGVAYTVAAIGCIATWFYRPASNVAFHIIRFSWAISGLFFLLFSILNYRTHIGQLVNLERGTNFMW